LIRGDKRGVASWLRELVENHPMITVHLSSKLSGLKGHVGNFESEITGPAGKSVIRHGVIIVATGGIEHKPTEYLYGQHPGVITQRELEARLAANSAFLDSGSVIAMIQCVGSRNEDRPFCSRSCCTEAVMNAIRIKESCADAEVYVFYRDMRTYGLNELYYQKARQMGVVFIRYEPENPPEVFRGWECRQGNAADGSSSESANIAGDRLMLRFVEPELGIPIQIRADLLVLSTGTTPALGNREISELARVPLNNDGFFLEAHIKLRPVDFASEGIFLCGSAHSPKTTAENIEQGLAAAGRAATILSKPTMTVGGQVSSVDVRKCVSCLTCIRVCPYGAPIVSPSNGKNRVEIQAAKCAGCGICAAECPARAIQLGHFTDWQVSAAIESLLESVRH